MSTPQPYFDKKQRDNANNRALKLPLFQNTTAIRRGILTPWTNIT